MAGIGFELRKLLEKDSLSGLLRGYGYAGMISSGPWVFSIMGILLVGYIAKQSALEHSVISQFQTTVTYLIAFSLMLSGLFQLSFTRYLSDQLYLNETHTVIPSLHGAMVLLTLLAGILCSFVVFFWMPNLSFLYQFSFISCFVTLCNVWLVTIMLSGLKEYRSILLLFAIAYGCTILLSRPLSLFGLEGLTMSFFLGQFMLLVGMLVITYQSYPFQQLVSFDFIKSPKVYWSLVFCGLFYNLGVWTDKLIFWFTPMTGQHILGPMYASVIYDLPIFLAYLSIIPGMAVFLVRMETDFVEYYDRFYSAVRDGGTLSHIRHMRNEMVSVARQGVFEIMKIQAIAVLLVFVIGPSILSLLDISFLYYHLLCIDVVGTGLQVVFLALMNVFFYLDKRRRVLILTALFVVFNAIFTGLTIYMGAFFYGYGFTLALLLVSTIGMKMLDQDFEELEYKTFMLQPV
jgi:uncharacterized membrane protein